VIVKPFLLLGAVLATGAANAPVAVHLDQLGFLPGAAKRAIVATDARAPIAWQLIAADGAVAARGMTAPFGDDRASGDHVQRIDFSAVQQPGRYRLTVAGVTTPSFTIGAQVFHALSIDALNYFYQTRAGIAIEARYAGGAAWARAAGHPHEVVTCFSGTDQRGTKWPGCADRYDVTGGWYDAGDQGKYVVNGGIALWTLQNLYETMLAAPPFADGAARLPEAGNGTNDLLDEARWEMEFLLSMQVHEGRRMALPVGPQPKKGALRLTEIDAGGMAFHKVADRNWTPLPTIPAEDPEERLLYPPSTAATLNLAATAAQAARLWRTIDPAFASRCLDAARAAYSAALRHPDILAAQAFDGSGGYGDQDVSDEFYWATAELFATTHDPALGRTLREMAAYTAPLQAPGWNSVAALGTMTLATAADVDEPDRDHARAAIITAADRFLAEEGRSGYQIPYATTAYPWGSNSSILNRGIVLGLAARFTGAERYRDGAVDTLDYVMGRNALGQSYVTGYGWQPMQHPHHRFWAKQFDAKLPGPPPGIVSGGANNTAFADPVAMAVRQTCTAAQRCWRDDARAFAFNEVAINWNAPLLWVATYLDHSAARRP
jgi:endoglucanase